ncbi:MAG: thioredoxin-disulfide reductase [Candidatus Gastranaerophilaceae bacterium]|nr:thioredoxin-disulfide reductase [Christensenellales bacterium]
MIDIAVIGGGPAGLTAGLYGARSGFSCSLFERELAGGQTLKTDMIANYPGFDEGIDGFTLSMRMRRQAEDLGLNFINEDVIEFAFEKDVKLIRTSSGEYEAKTVIIATGAQPRKLGLPNENALTGKGVSYCAVCDAAFFTNANVAVVGGGDTAITDALHLARFAAHVTVVHRRNELRANPLLQAKAYADSKIEFIYNSVVSEIMGENSVAGIVITDVNTGKQRHADVSGLFVAIGNVPRTELVRDKLKLTPGGYVLTDSRMRSSVDGVYAVGDVRDTPLRQVVTAAADGAVAASDAADRLSISNAGASSGKEA